jgi:hypothetical protein
MALNLDEKQKVRLALLKALDENHPLRDPVRLVSELGYSQPRVTHGKSVTIHEEGIRENSPLGLQGSIKGPVIRSGAYSKRECKVIIQPTEQGLVIYDMAGDGGSQSVWTTPGVLIKAVKGSNGADLLAVTSNCNSLSPALEVEVKAMLGVLGIDASTAKTLLSQSTLHPGSEKRAPLSRELLEETIASHMSVPSYINPNSRDNYTSTGYRTKFSEATDMQTRVMPAYVTPEPQIDTPLPTAVPVQLEPESIAPPTSTPPEGYLLANVDSEFLTRITTQEATGPDTIIIAKPRSLPGVVLEIMPARLKAQGVESRINEDGSLVIFGLKDPDVVSAIEAGINQAGEALKADGSTVEKTEFYSKTTTKDGVVEIAIGDGKLLPDQLAKMKASLVKHRTAHQEIGGVLVIEGLTGERVISSLVENINFLGNLAKAENPAAAGDSGPASGSGRTAHVRSGGGGRIP